MEFRSAEELSAINNAYEYSTLNNASVADINGYQFGDGSLEANPDTTNGIIEAYQNIYGELPSDEILETLVGLASQEMMFGGSENLEAACRLVVEQYGAGISGDEAEFWETEDGENTEQGNQYAAWNPLSHIINPARQLEQQEMAEAQQQAQAATQKHIFNVTLFAINNIDERNLDYEKYKKQIAVATRGLAQDSQEYKTKKIFATLVASLKDLISQSKNIFSTEQLNKLQSAVAGKIVQMMAGKITYDANSGSTPFDANGNFVAPLNFVCSKFTSLCYYIMGVSKQGNAKPKGPYNNGYNAWNYNTNAYSYGKYKMATKTEEYIDQETGETKKRDITDIGVTHMAHNETLFEQPGLDLGQIKSLFATKNVEELKKLEGKTFMFNASGNHFVPNITSYEHTGIFGPYDPVTNTITVYESNTGYPYLHVNKYSLNTFERSFKVFKVVQTRY